MSQFRVQTEVFEGPMDLLLYLIRKEEVDIHEVNLTRLATEFIEYVEVMRRLDLELAGEFLVMAATMVYIKSKELLPVNERVVGEGEEDEEDDPRWELIRQLVEYKRFKDAAAKLQEIEAEQESVYPRTPEELELGAAPFSLRQKSSVLLLVNAVNRMLKRLDSETSREIVDDQWTVGDQMQGIEERIQRHGRFRFFDALSERPSQMEVVTLFLAMLEMIRLRRIRVEQGCNFGEIDVVKNDVEDPQEPDQTPDGQEAIETE